MILRTIGFLKRGVVHDFCKEWKELIERDKETLEG